MNPNSSTRPRIGLIGVTGYAQIYIDFLLGAHEAKRLELVATTIVPAQEQLPVVDQLRRMGVRIYTDYLAMMEAEAGHMDLCFIPTGIQWHARMTCAALRAGANVLVEKPLAGSLADAESVRQCEAETGRWVAVGFQDVYAPEVSWMKRQLLNGSIGRIRRVRMLGLWPRPEAYYRRNHWAGKLRTDGAATMDSPLNNAFAHFVNLAIYLAASEYGIAATLEVTGCELYRAHEIESFDTAVVTARSRSGVEFWFGVSHACANSREPEICLEGENGTAEWFHERHYQLAPHGQAPERKCVPDYPRTRGCMFDAVLARQADGQHAICDTTLAMGHTRLIEAAHAAGEIRTVDPAFIERRPLGDNGDIVPVIRGLEESIQEACRKGSLLRDVGFQPAATRVRR